MARQDTLRPVDKLFKRYAEFHQNPQNMLIHWVAVPLATFSALGLIWGIPFPHLDFLGRYNGFVNWASFVIAFSIYYYYRLEPVLSYAMLLFVFAASAGIVSLEKLHTNSGWPEMWEVCLIIFILSQIALLVAHKFEGKQLPLRENFGFMLIAPLWLFDRLLSKIRKRGN